MNVALALTGGGARAAYQAGVLYGISEITGAARLPFDIVAGVSAGAINGMAIASGADDFGAASAQLWDTWSDLTTNQVFRTDARTIARIGARWVHDLSLGGHFGTSTSSYLLDTAPLRRLLASRIDFRSVRAHVRERLLHGVAVSATNYGSGAAMTFFDGHPSIAPWSRGTRLAKRSTIELGHVMASSAIPVFFPPERLEGSYYGDGCVRLSAPLSPAVHLGAERVLAIGVRHERSPEHAAALTEREMSRIQPIDVAGVLLNAVFLDSLDADLERMQRINRTLALLGDDAYANHPDGLRCIEVMAIRPSQDLGTLAAEELEHLPATLRYMLRGLGASGEKGWDVLSYLAFDSSYTRLLLELGLEDARARADEIVELLTPARSPSGRLARGANAVQSLP